MPIMGGCPPPDSPARRPVTSGRVGLFIAASLDRLGELGEVVREIVQGEEEPSAPDPGDIGKIEPRA